MWKTLKAVAISIHMVASILALAKPLKANSVDVLVDGFEILLGGCNWPKGNIHECTTSNKIQNEII